MTALLAGPTSAETAAGLSSAIPRHTMLLGLRISSGTATVDLSSAFIAADTPTNELARVAEVVYTLTQFPTVTRVAFKIPGSTPSSYGSAVVSLERPLGRSDLVSALPPILVESPAVGDRLRGTVRLSGLADVYEAQFNVQLIDGAGRVLLADSVRATAGSGTWGAFDVSLPFQESAGSMSTLKVYDISPKDGSVIDEVDIPLFAGP